MKKRYALIDTLRGLAIISMIGYHACWIMSYFGILISADTLFSSWFNAWQKSICISFIVIPGFSFSLGSNHVRSGLIVFGWGLIITVITVLFFYDIRIIFGVLTLTGSAILLTIPVDKLLNSRDIGNKSCYMIFLAVEILLFLFTYNINRGYLGFGSFRLNLPAELYNGYIATYLGFMTPGFYSTDYFSLMPWYFLYFFRYDRHSLRHSPSSPRI